MAYSIDLRKRVLDFIQTGGKKAEAARRFSVNRSTIYRWLAAEDPFSTQKPGPKNMRVLDEKHAAGKKIVYVDECGFRAEGYRRHGYASKDECILGLIY